MAEDETDNDDATMRVIAKVTFKCGSIMAMAGTVDQIPLMTEKAKRFAQRDCPVCQLRKGDINEEELQLLYDEFLNEVGDDLMQTFAEAAEQLNVRAKSN